MSCRYVDGIPRIAAVSLAAFLTGCAPVASVGKRVDGGDELAVRKMQVYSFVPLHAMGSGRLHRDARGFDEALAEQLSAARADVMIADVEELVRRHGLAVEVRVDDGGGRQLSATMPEGKLLEAQRAAESVAGVTHRLVILPLRLKLDHATGIAHGVLRWRVEATGDSSPVAVGLMRYTADARGYPAKRMASVLVAKLRSLGIR